MKTIWWIDETSVLMTMRHWDELKEYMGVDMGSEEGDRTAIIYNFDLLTDDALYHSLIGVLNLLKEGKPDERSECARRFAVTITEMEKVVAYFHEYVYKQHDSGE